MNFELIEQKRIDERFTVVNFCNAVGIDRTTYYQYKKQPEKMPVSIFLKMADVLNLSAKEKHSILN